MEHHRDALRAWRAKNQITQEQAARAANIALGTYRCWESGTSAGGPSAACLVRLEACFPGLLALLGDLAQELRHG